MRKVLGALIAAVAFVAVLAVLAASPASASGGRSHTPGSFQLEIDG